MPNITEALKLLQAGNKRFASWDSLEIKNRSPDRREEIIDNQQPIAVVIGCSDSRVPPEIIFDQGLGDLFVIRVAGNTVGPIEIGTVEFAVQNFGPKLIVVLGHTGCGAVLTTLVELARGRSELTPCLNEIVDRIQPAVEPLLRTKLREDPKALLNQAVVANVNASIDQLLDVSDMLRNAVQRGEVGIIGAMYSLETGVVHFHQPH